MAPPKANKQKAKKTVKKGFFDVKAPITATKIQLYATDAESLDGRTVKLDMTKSLRGKGLELKLRIKYVEGELVAEPESVVLVSSYVSRAVRRGTDYAEDSFRVECRDCFARVKPLFITRRRVSKLVLKTIRSEAKEFLENHMKTRSAKEVFSEILSNKIQKQLSIKLKKIYPLAFSEIRMFEVEEMKAEVPAQ